MGDLYIGTCGWNFLGWKVGFYSGVRQKDWLRHCTERFSALEIDGTFYRRLAERSAIRYRDEPPPRFRFTAKGHRIVTHMRRLQEIEPSIAIHREAFAAMGERLLAVFWQLPQNFRRDDARLANFLQTLGDGWPGMRFAMEFRHESWFDDHVAAILAGHGAANVISDCADWPIWDAVTAPLVYVRLHGHERGYAARYSDGQLKGWAAQARGWMDEGREVHIYLDNDMEGHAPFDAMRLMAALGQEPE